MKKRIAFFFLVIFLSLDLCAQQQQEVHDQKEVQEAERLLPFFDQKFKTDVLDKVTTPEDYASFYQYAMEYIVRDRSLFFGKALHGELKEKDIDDYLEKQVLRVYKNVKTEFLNKKNSPVKETTLLPESAGDPCNNIDFESGTTTGWDGWTGFASEDPYPPNSSLFPGFQPQQHAIMSGSGVYDAIVGGSLLSTVAPGGNYSLRLENTYTGGNLSRISQTFLVNPANANFTYRYAVVLEDPSNSHTDPQRPFFRIRVLDQSGNEILCGHYEVIAKPPITGFQQVPSTNYYWRDWTSVAIPLASYVGQNVTVEFTASDCSLGGHLGYAYIDGSCFQSSIVSVPSGSCGGLPYTLIAPPGYASYAWTGPGIVGAANVQTITVNQTGTYACVITSVSGPTCKTTLKAVVGSNPTINAGPDFYICPGGYAQLNASVSLTNAFSWSPTATLTNPNTLNPIARPTTTTTYYLTGCGKIDSATVYVDQVDFSITPDFTTCGTSTVSLSAAPTVAGSYTYSWSPSTGMTGATTATPTVTLSGTTTYSVTVTNVASGCSNTKQVTVTVNPGSTTNAGADKAYCGTPVQLNAVGGTSFTWTDINGNPPVGLSCSNCSNPLASPSVSTSYIVTSNLTAPCVNKDTVMISASSLSTINLGKDTSLCLGETLLLDAGNAGATYKWSTGALSKTISVNTSGLYWAEASDGVCKKRDSILVTIVNPPIVNLGNDTVLCTGSTVNLNARNNGATYAWSTGAVSQAIVASVQGYYWVDVNNGKCPVKRDSIYVSNINKPIVNLGHDTLLCAGVMLPLNASNVGSSYGWSTGVTTQTISVSMQGIYWVDVNNGVCPKVRDSITVNYKNKPIVNLGIDSTICTGQQVLLDAQNATYLHQWSTGALSQTILASTQGYYWVDVDNGVCPKVRDSIYLTVLSYPVVNIGPDATKCITDLVTLDAAHPSLSVVWSTGATTHTITPDLSDIYWADVANGRCITRDSATITYVPISTVNFGTDTTVCNGTIILLKSLNSGTYTWSTGELTQGIYVSNPGNYWVDIDNGYCALKRHNVIVHYVNPPVVDLGADSLLVCYNDTVKLDAANAGGAFTWYNKKNNHLASSQQVIFYNNITGYYWVSVFNGTCARKDSVYINFTVNPNPLPDTAILCEGDKKVFKAGGGFKSYLWQDGSVDSIFIAYVSDLLQDTIRVKMVDFYGCTYLDSMILFAIDCTVEELFIPNLITPNNDLSNDKFHVKGLPKESELTVYSRWGDRIYHNSDYDNSWGGEGASDGVYYFTLKLNDGKEYKSWVQIIK